MRGALAFGGSLSLAFGHEMRYLRNVLGSQASGLPEIIMYDNTEANPKRKHPCIPFLRSKRKKNATLMLTQPIANCAPTQR